LSILNSQGQVVENIRVAPASNQLLPIKVSSLIGENEPGNHPIHFDVSAQEIRGNKTIVRKRHEKSTFIIPQ